MNTLSKISQKRVSSQILPLHTETLKKIKTQEEPLSKINWSLLKYCNPKKLTQSQINIYKIYLQIIKDKKITYPPFFIFEDQPPKPLIGAFYVSATNTIVYCSSSNTRSDKYIKSVLEHELNHYNDHMKIAFIILLAESNSPLIKENDKKFIEFYKQQISSIRNIYPYGKEIDSRVNRKMKTYQKYSLSEQKDIVEEGRQHLKDFYAIRNIGIFLQLILNSQKNDFEFENNDEKLIIVKEVLENFKNSKTLNNTEKQTIESILDKINPITGFSYNLRHAKKSILHLTNEEKKQLDKSLRQYCDKGILTEHKSYMITDKILNSQFIINLTHLNKYYLGKNLTQFEIYRPLYKQYDAYINKKGLKNAPFILPTINVPNNMHINSDYTVSLDDKISTNEGLFDLILKSYILKMLIKHERLPNLNDSNLLFYKHINRNCNLIIKSTAELLQKNEKHLKDLEDEYNENGLAIRILKNDCVSEILRSILPRKKPIDEITQTFKILALFKILTTLSNNLCDIDEDKKTEIGNIIEVLKKFYIEQLLPEPPRSVTFTDKQYSLLQDIQKNPDFYFNL